MLGSMFAGVEEGPGKTIILKVENLKVTEEWDQ